MAAPTPTTPAKTAPAGVTLEQLIGAPIDTAGISRQAHAQALADTGAVISQLRANQAAINQQARQRANDATQASQGAARFLQSLGLGPALAASYRSAAGDQASLASGFSGELQRTVGDQGAQVSAALKALGAPGGAPTSVRSAGNAVYGIGGALPANAMLAEAPLQVALANQGPASLLAQGRQQAIGTLGAGQRQAAAINAQIGSEAAKAPALESRYVSQLTSSAEKSKQDTINNVIKVQSAQALADYRAAEIDARKGDAAAKIAAANAKAALPDSSLSRAVGYLVNAHGDPIVGKNGQPVILPGFQVDSNGSIVKVSTTKKGTGGSSLSATGVTSFLRGLAKTTRVPVLDANGNTTLDANNKVEYQSQTQFRLPYEQAYQQLVQSGMGDRAARKALDTVYPKGQGGRSWLTNEQQTVLQKTPQGAATGTIDIAGLSGTRAYITQAQASALKKSGKLPNGFWYTADQGHVVYVIKPGY